MTRAADLKPLAATEHQSKIKLHRRTYWNTVAGDANFPVVALYWKARPARTVEPAIDVLLKELRERPPGSLLVLAALAERSPSSVTERRIQRDALSDGFLFRSGTRRRRRCGCASAGRASCGTHGNVLDWWRVSHTSRWGRRNRNALKTRYGEKYTRCRFEDNKYDPANFFRLNQKTQADSGDGGGRAV